jgi:transmembrane sensor
MSERETGEVIDAQAADWAARVDAGPLSAEEQSALDAWLEGDSRRLGAYARARAVFAHVQRARALGPDFDAAEFVVPVSARPAAPSRRQLWTGGAAAAALAATAGAGLQWRSTHFHTRLGEVRLVPLPDGSSMTLNTASRATIAFSKSERRVRLVQGEAIFDVAKDAARPFLVDAADTQVRAVGTSFVVRRLADRPVQVVVCEGVVEVKRGTTAFTPPIRVAANTRAVAADHGVFTASTVSATEIRRELVWREGFLAFEDEPLQQAITEFARYSDTPIVVDDPAVAEETVTGLFRANNPAGFAKAVAEALDLKADVTDRQVRLYR